MNVQHQLLRLHVLLGDDEDQLDELYQSFQAADPDSRGSLKSTVELESVLRRHLSLTDFKKIDVEALSARFPTATNCFDYTAFCKTLQRPPSLQLETSPRGPQAPFKRRSRSPTKLQRGPQSPFKRRSRSPTKLRQRSRSPTKSQYREQGRLRLDKRLESQRFLMESVRYKLIRGMQGDESDGFQGLQNALYRLDVAGDGYVDERVFMKKFIQRLKIPLTRPEREFLLEQLRAQSTTKGEHVLDYEQIGRICNLNSDASLSEADTEPEETKPSSPSKTSQLGANFLAAEKKLGDFLRTPLVIREIGGNEIPRCSFTGAEKFLEIAEAVDENNTGLLHEDEFVQILSKCGVSIDPALLTGMLSRFPRSNGKHISYSAFLQRYGQNPQCSRGRRELKELILRLLARLTVPPVDWKRFLHDRFENFDNDMHGVSKGMLPTEAFLQAVQGRSIVMKLSMDEAAQVTSLFLRASPSSSPTRIHYHEFLRFIDECRMPPIDTKSVPNLVISTGSPMTQCSEPDPVSTDEMSVCDYLMFHATVPERRNFENLMEMLQEFQTTTKIDQKLSPVANGILIPLGEKLRVQVQFSLI